jgi:hypothetical protein
MDNFKKILKKEGQRFKIHIFLTKGRRDPYLLQINHIYFVIICHALKKIIQPGFMGGKRSSLDGISRKNTLH